MKHFSALTLCLFLVAACQTAESTTTEEPEATADTLTQKEKALAFVGAVESQDSTTLRELATAEYIQHNPFIPSGLDPLIGLLPVLNENGTTIETVRVIEDGDFIVLHQKWTNVSFLGAEEMVSFDVLRFDESGKIAEHWDALTPVVKETTSGRTQTDGPTTIEDLEQTEANKALAVSLIEDVLMGKDPGKITEYISSEAYHQHNPQIKDGLSGIMEAVEYLTKQGNMFQYTKIHKVIGEGNFVLTISEGQWGGKTHAFYDLLRISDGKIVEHWDVIQEVPTDNLANENTMFGF